MNTEDLGGRGLLLQGSSRVSVISRAFSIAITACAAKFCSSAVCLSEERPHLLAVFANAEIPRGRLMR